MLAFPTLAHRSGTAGWGLTMGVLYFFPDGRFVPGWARPMLVVLGAVVVAWILFPSSPFNFSERYSLPPLSFVLLMVLVFASVTELSTNALWALVYDSIASDLDCPRRWMTCLMCAAMDDRTAYSGDRTCGAVNRGRNDHGDAVVIGTQPTVYLAVGSRPTL
jgi:hypothetical protein